MNKAQFEDLLEEDYHSDKLYLEVPYGNQVDVSIEDVIVSHIGATGNAKKYEEAKKILDKLPKMFPKWLREYKKPVNPINRVDKFQVMKIEPEEKE